MIAVRRHFFKQNRTAIPKSLVTAKRRLQYTLTKPGRLTDVRKQYGLTNHLSYFSLQQDKSTFGGYSHKPMVVIVSSNYQTCRWICLCHYMGNRVMVYIWSNRHSKRMDHWGEV
ncbi:hypothetical protein TNCV_4034131 [Trichonephila clavipes]|nr:hypothetical protein TNCV_4034131 [Trichonephila clavipes]